MNRPLVVRGMWGLGDNIFQRPFIRALSRRHEVFLETPWPEIYADLPIEFVRPVPRQLRTQMVNVKRQNGSRWTQWPRGARHLEVSYDLTAGRNIVTEMERRLGVAPELPFDLPDFGTWRVAIDKPLALIRPVTLRREWQNAARNPRPEHLTEAVATLRELGFYTIAVADLKEGHEWAEGQVPETDEAFLRGELTTLELLALARASSIICGGVGWIVPASIALSVPAFVLLGGQGGHNAPEKITDQRMNLTKIEFAIPEDFCRCLDMLHPCKNKTIAELPAKLKRFVDRVIPHSSRLSPKVA